MQFSNLIPENDSADAIVVTDLKKSFSVFKRREGILGAVKDLFNRNHQTLWAVEGISFTVRRGEMIGFIGPNGAGKSTTIKMLTGILKPTAGEMRVLGFRPFEHRKRYCRHIGVVFGQRTQLWWDIAVIESFKLLQKIYRVPDSEFKKRLDTLIEILDLQEVLHTPVRKLSLGQRLRSDLAASLLHGPELLFLDEPTIGVDAVAKLNIRGFLKRINREFKATVVLTTHDLVEIEELCDRIIIIDKGKLVYDGDLQRIRELPGVRHHVTVEFAAPVAPEVLEAAFQSRAKFKADDGKIIVEYSPDQIPTVELVRGLVDRFEVSDLSTREPEIEDILIKIYREGL